MTMHIGIASSQDTASPVAAPLSAVRGSWGEILRIEGPAGATQAADIIRLFSSVLPESYADYDRKLRGDSLNLDLYGYDPEQGVTVIQLRHASRRHANWYMGVRKDYVLVGRNESGTYFRHPLTPHTIHPAVRKDPSDPRSAIRAAQRWMWRCTDKQLASARRQGDVLLIPATAPPKKTSTPVAAQVVTIAGMHEIHASEFRRNGEDVYAFAPTLRHSKGQHLPVYADNERWYLVRAAQAAQTWGWGSRIAD